MFARGVVSLHTPPLLGRKPSSVKSRISITSKLIQIKGLQPHYFRHLQKTGGRGHSRPALSGARFLRPVCFTGAEGPALSGAEGFLSHSSLALASSLTPF